VPKILSRPHLLVLLVIALACAGCAATEATERPRTLAAVMPVKRLPGDPFDRTQATVRNLDPDLLAALEDAAHDAADDGVTLVVTSGWRSRSHQERLFAEAVRRYGSEEEASRYVSTPDTSAHVTGDAVDVGPRDADAWLSRHGSAYGLCQVFANEVWHYELATSPGGSCPEMLPDGSYRGEH
jgi:D-alanyl-D-alanine carboxypeptidase